MNVPGASGAATGLANAAGFGDEAGFGRDADVGGAGRAAGGGGAAALTADPVPAGRYRGWPRLANYEREEADMVLADQMMGSLRRREDEQRRSKIERLKEAIRSNSYENPLKLSVAVDRMLAGGPPAADEDDDADAGMAEPEKSE